MEEAGPGEILRSVQKDDLYLNRIKQSVSGLWLDACGGNSWMWLEEWLEPACRFLYYSITTLSGIQTLGEEYTGLIQVTGDSKASTRIPSRYRRFVMIFMQTFGPKLVKMALLKTKRFINSPGSDLEPKAISTLNKVMPLLELSLDLVEKVNTCIFYYQSMYYHLARRMTEVRYLKRNTGADTTRQGFRFLGHIASLHLVLTSGLALYKHFKSTTSTDQEHSRSPHQQQSVGTSAPSDESPETGRCSLCLDPLGSRGPPSTTTCGHVFCWTCIHEALAMGGECALCRQPVNSNRIIPLQNY